MKKLILLRHAAAENSNPANKDSDRKLTDYGKKQADDIGAKLVETGIKPGRVISSDAKRARETATIAAQKLGVPEREIQYDSNLYETTAGFLMDYIHDLPDDEESVMLVGHNPSFSDFAVKLGRDFTKELTKGAAVCFSFNTENWREITSYSGNLEFYLFPELIQAQ